MNGHDFDHNGRTDSRDYYIYSSVCSDDNDNASTGRTTSSGIDFESSNVLLLLAMVFFFSWLNGSMGTGFFACVLGIPSGIYLFLRLMMWAYS